MLIKSADDKNPHIDALSALLDRPDVDAALRKRIEFEIKACRAGVRGEAEAAYEIDFNYKAREGWAVIHDLRIEVGQRVAQIDHLLLNRLLECYVLETKSFSEGLGVNEHGEFVRFFGGRPSGMPSPIEQNRKHIAVLEELFASNSMTLPTRLGMTLRPACKSFIVVSSGARISRPKKDVPGLDELVKADQLKTRLDKEVEKASLLKLVAAETVQALARQLVAHHKPAKLAVAARFGLPETPPAPAPVRQAPPAPAPAAARAPVSPRPASAAPEPTPKPAVIEVEAPAPSGGKSLSCEACTGPLSSAEARFCRFNKPKFNNRLLCRTCQQTASANS